MSGKRGISIVILFIISLIPGSILAQKFTGGLKLGLVGSQVAGDLYGGYNKAGINAGGWIGLPVSPKSQLQMELAYIQKGSRQNPNQEKGQLDSYLMQLGYIELPFLYRYKYKTQIEFEGGLSMNFLLHHNEEINGYKQDKNPFKKQNLCFMAGLSYGLNDKLRINIRTDNSLFSLRKNRVTGDVWRFWGHGQFSDALVIGAYYNL